MDKEICICAAVLTKDGIAIRGHRHGDCFHTIIQMGKTIKKNFNSQGFITSKNRYVNRKVGAILQQNANILSVWTKKPVNGMLFSEDLY